MKQSLFWLFGIALGVVIAFFSDLVNWMPGRERLYRPNTKSDHRYSADGLEVHRNNHFDIFVFDPDEFEFGVSRSRPENADFFINSNFFTKSGNHPIGLVVEDGKKVSSSVRGGGCFFVRRRKPQVSIGSCPSNVRHASQTIFWAIRNGKPNRKLVRDRWSNRKEFRSFIGIDRSGQVVAIVSRLGGIATVGDAVETGLEFGVVDGLLLDGGSSVEYAYSDGAFSSRFRALSASLKKLRGIPEPPVFIVAERRSK